MRSERDLIIETSIWEQVQSKWDADLEDDPGCMFATCVAGDNLADNRAKKGKKKAPAGPKKLVKKTMAKK